MKHQCQYVVGVSIGNSQKEKQVVAENKPNHIDQELLVNEKVIDTLGWIDSP